MTLPETNENYLLDANADSLDGAQQAFQRCQEIFSYIADVLGSSTPTAAADESVLAFEGGVAAGSVGRRLNFGSNHFDVSEDAGANNWYGVTLGAGGVTATELADGAADNTKLADMAQARIRGRQSGGGTGDPEDLTAAMVRTIINVADGANAYVHPNHTGDVTSVADGAQTIANDAVTYAKMQNVVNDERVLGRVSGADGVIEELTQAQILTFLGGTTGSGQLVLETNPTFADDIFLSTAQPQIRKSTGSVYLTFLAPATPVNSIVIRSADTAVSPAIDVQGTDANIGLNIITKNSGVVQANGVEVVTVSGTQTLTNKTLTTPTIASLTNAQHNHSDAAGGGTLDLTGNATICFFTAATGGGTITNKTFEANTVPSNKILTAFESDNDSITVTVEMHSENDSWQPADVTVSGGGATPVTVLKQNWTQVGTARIWTASVNLTDADTTGTLTATMSDGDASTCTYTRALDPPLITAAVFDTHAGTTGGDPLVDKAQTQTTSTTATQTVRITGTTESHATKIWVTNAGVSSVEQGPFDVTAGAFDFTINVRSSASSGSQTATLECAVGTGGTRGATSNTSNTVSVSHTLPIVTGPTVGNYPASQEAIKDVETADVTITHTNIDAGDDYTYTDNGTSELTIPSNTDYAATKTVTRAGGNYREVGTNYVLLIKRLAKNGTTLTTNTTVKIAHVVAVITVAKNTGGTALDRMGTDNGTNSYKDQTVYLNSSQANLSTHTPVLTQDAGDTGSAWQGSWATSGNLRYTRSLRISDAAILTGGQAANNHTWLSCSIKNRAGKETTTVTTNGTYSIGGFATRTLTIAAWPNRTGDLSVLVVDTSKLTCFNYSKNLSFAFDNSPGSGSTPDNEVDKFCIVNGSDLVDDDHQNWYNKDEANAISNTSGTASIDVTESV